MKLNSQIARLGAVARLLVGVAWIWSSWSQIRAPRTFRQAVRGLDGTPEWASTAIAYGVPMLAFCVGVLLVAGLGVRLTASASTVLSLLLLILVGQAAARDELTSWSPVGLDGSSGSTSYLAVLLGLLLMVALSGLLVVWPKTALSVDAYLARFDHVEMPSKKRMSTEQGRRKYQTAVEAAQRKVVIRARYLNTSLALVAAMMVLVALGVQTNRAKVAGALTATNANSVSGVTDGTAAAATVEIYEDYLCPGCQTFGTNAQIAKTLAADVKANRAQVRYLPVGLRDDSTDGSGYSTRVANAAVCASDVSVDFFLKYRAKLYSLLVDPSGKALHPTTASAGSLLKLVGYANDLKIPAADQVTFRDCVQGMTHKAIVDSLTEQFSRKSISTLPAVFVNGKRLAGPDLASLTAAIARADATGPKPTLAPSGSAAPSGAVRSGAVPSTTLPSGAAPVTAAVPTAVATP